MSCVCGVLLATDIAPLSAQDCGDICKDCGWFRWEGIDYNQNGPHHMNCNTLSSYCTGCELPLISDGRPDAQTVAALLLSASMSNLAAVVEKYGDRLLLNRSRNVLVVQGTSCSDETFATVVFLAAERAKALHKLGIRSLKEFLRTEIGHVITRNASVAHEARN
jgi:hypothetical protein